MRFRALPLVALLTALAPAGAAHAATPTTGPDGLRCGAVSATDPSAPGGVQTAAVFAGPLLVTDPATGIASGTVTCTIQVGGDQHSDPDNGAFAGASGTGVVVLPASLVSFNAFVTAPLYVCTRFTYSTGEVFYADGGGGGAWTTDASAACDRLNPIVDAEQVEGLLDAVVCPLLDVVPVVASTLRNLWGCDRDVLSSPGIRAFVPRP